MSNSRTGTTSETSPRRAWRVAIAGSSGLIGSALAASLISDGHTVLRLVRRDIRAPGEVNWAPQEGRISLEALGAVNAIINLSGEGIATQRWTARRRESLLSSRLDSTRTLVRAIGRMNPKPDVFVCASAVGFYGDTGDRVLSEDAPAGAGFLADLCVSWEREARVAEELFGVRTVMARTGLVLAPSGGVLAKLLPIFRLGLGGPIGGGRAWMSWISLDDHLRAVMHALRDEGLSGAVNLVSPEPVRGSVFAQGLGRALRRPAWAPVPAALLKLAFGRMAEETLLSSQRAIPGKLLRTGFSFRHPLLMQALTACVSPERV